MRTLEKDCIETQDRNYKKNISKPRKANVELQLIFIVQIDGR